ncbi:MAG: cupin domain-containing protein [Halieaceae bacterium]|nr:cupin domain-containing protein [Halieaceae bacterium]
MNHNALPAPFVDQEEIAWEPHPRYPSVFFKPLISGADNEFTSIALVRFPPGGVIGIHIHPKEVETIYALSGEGIFTLQEQEMSFSAGQIVSVPIAMEHGLRNESAQDLDIMTIFTPPLF